MCNRMTVLEQIIFYLKNNFSTKDRRMSWVFFFRTELEPNLKVRKRNSNVSLWGPNFNSNLNSYFSFVLIRLTRDGQTVRFESSNRMLPKKKKKV